MNNIEGKKLLIISSEKKDESFVNNAKDMGVFTICCDKYKDYNISKAKKIADEAWDIDYNNTNEIVKKCKETGVTGVIAGYHEDRVEAASKIAKELNLPFYVNLEQIDLTRDKNKFKKECKTSGIKVPKSFYLEDLPKKVDYPIIIKPSDGCGRKGISIVYKPDELESAISFAKDNSKNGKIVIEEYIKGTELMAVYTLKNGEFSLSCLNDKYLSEDPEGPTLCDVAMGPSKYLDHFMEVVDPRIKRLLKSIGAKDGVANFQFIVNDKGIYAFEMGYRLNGNDDWKTIEKYNGINFVKMLIHHSLTGNMGEDIRKDNPRFPEYAVTLCGYTKAGIIGKIEKDGLKFIPNIWDILFLKNEGNTIPEGHTNAKKTFLVKFTAKSINEVADIIKKIQNNIKITDTEGNDMLLKKFDTKRLFS